MMDLVAKNNEMLSANKYNTTDTRLMAKVASLAVPNDYDLYLIACTLCNYDIPEKAEAMNLRMKYFLATNHGNSMGYEHIASDYKAVRKTTISCVNANHTNKYGHFDYYINCTSADLVHDLWSYKDKECLKYVDNRTYKDRLVVSVAHHQFRSFVKMLDELLINYDFDNLTNGVFHNNVSSNKLIDVSKLDLPFTPYPFQIEDANTIVRMKRAIIGHEMGLGKTFIATLVGMSIAEPKIVICPESLRVNWRKELSIVDKEADIQILLSGETPHFGKDWTVMGYKTACKFEEYLKNFNCVFVDEAQNCKAVDNWGRPSSKRAATIINLAMNADFCYLLTGTPIPARNKDLYNIFKMLKCEKFNFTNKWAFKNFADKFCDPRSTYFGLDYSGNSNSTELHDILKLNMIRRLRKDVLPDLTKQRQFIPITPKFKSDYKDIESRLYFPEDGDSYMSLAMTGRNILSKYKLDTAIDLADSLMNAGESVVIVTNFVETADKLVDHYAGKCCEIRGGMSDYEKQVSIDAFQNKNAQICVLSLMAGGVGLTLTAAHTMIIIDYAWLPADMMQVEDRICRAGQTKHCMIYYIYCDNSIFDNTFIETISTKSENIDIVVDAVENTYNIAEECVENSTYIDKLKAFIAASTPTKKPKKSKTKATS